MGSENPSPLQGNPTKRRGACEDITRQYKHRLASKSCAAFVSPICEKSISVFKISINNGMTSKVIYLCFLCAITICDAIATVVDVNADPLQVCADVTWIISV
jgi:hypothetical protein